MYQTFAWYSQLGALPRALLLFPLGLVIGSFSTMLRHRIPLRQSIVRPGSHCPACGHGLGAADLVPVFSYLWLRGRCRYCHVKIGGRYLAIELGSGVLVAGAGLIGGWTCGFLALMGIPVGVVFKQRASRRDIGEQHGVALVEILVALALLVSVAIPLYQAFTNNIRGLSTYQRQFALALAQSKLEDIQAQKSKIPTAFSNSPGFTAYDPGIQVGDVYLCVGYVDDRPPGGNPSEVPIIRKLEVTVDFGWDSLCTDPTGATPVRVVTYIAKTP